jgi:hypothetical protein
VRSSCSGKSIWSARPRRASLLPSRVDGHHIVPSGRRVVRAAPHCPGLRQPLPVRRRRSLSSFVLICEKRNLGAPVTFASSFGALRRVRVDLLVCDESMVRILPFSVAGSRASTVAMSRRDRDWSCAVSSLGVGLRPCRHVTGQTSGVVKAAPNQRRTGAGLQPLPFGRHRPDRGRHRARRMTWYLRRSDRQVNALAPGLFDRRVMPTRLPPIPGEVGASCAVHSQQVDWVDEHPVPPFRRCPFRLVWTRLPLGPETVLTAG